MANGSFGGGDGTEENPYLVEDAEDLDAIREIEKDGDEVEPYYFKQTNDIDLSSYENWEPIKYAKKNEEDDDQVTVFDGVYDGGEYKIKNLTIDSEDDNIGLFGKTEEAILENIFLENVNVKGDGYVGALSGYFTGTVSNCHVNKGEVKGSFSVGGLLGGHLDGEIKNCSTDINVIGDVDVVGGLFGEGGGVYLIKNSSAKGDVVGGGSDTGGLIGNLGFTQELNYCFAKGDVKGNENVGGLIGSGGNIGETGFCYSTGNVEGESGNVGGFIGGISHAVKLSNIYSTGNVIAYSGKNVGGLIGELSYVDESGLYNSYSAGDIYANSQFVGGVIGDLRTTMVSCYYLGENIYTGENVESVNDIYGKKDEYQGKVYTCFSLEELELKDWIENE